MQPEILSGGQIEFSIRSGMESIGSRVRKAREDKGLSQSALGKLVGLAQSTIQEFEAGDVKRSKKLYEIARALKVEQEWLLTGKEPRVRQALDSAQRYPELPKDQVNINATASNVTDNGATKAGETLREDSPKMIDTRVGIWDEIVNLDDTSYDALVRFLRTLQRAATKDMNRPRKPGKAS